MNAGATHWNRIAVDPTVVHGKPRIRGTRVTVQAILELLAAGETFEELLEEYDELSREDIVEALEYAASVAGGLQVQALVP
ncbi:DUF433 domain-containing protein [Myceligenerans pegani]|uniref:DUF433 domain-containing protein n=1 Tax=Myceligenerans pegani TaxID=2776917 RepID=A0ABR9N2W5_9MICO|nr:DUF433 domain-containing protein [Myceligenerans sp. TRM 65318]MBE1877448.1 DUF433 domain-containing protein [Myceligenerans sp. TRM 65318]MBE3019719.1 DUF433 domain-containing protein [Myceligenerans sp. TRM 65318]